MSNARAIQQMIIREARALGVDPTMALVFGEIESGFNPGRISPGSGLYKGVFQLSDGEFKKHGGTGSIFNPQANIRAGIRKIATETAQFSRKYGRAPTGAEMYLVHQQGWGGYDAHTRNPNQLAYKSMAGTGEGRQKGEGWAQKAIAWNVPAKHAARYGGALNMTSGQFANHWTNDFNRRAAKFGGPAYKHAGEQPQAEYIPEGYKPDMEVSTWSPTRAGGDFDPAMSDAERTKANRLAAYHAREGTPEREFGGEYIPDVSPARHKPVGFSADHFNPAAPPPQTTKTPATPTTPVGFAMDHYDPARPPQQTAPTQPHVPIDMSGAVPGLPGEPGAMDVIGAIVGSLFQGSQVKPPAAPNVQPRPPSVSPRGGNFDMGGLMALLQKRKKFGA